MTSLLTGLLGGGPAAIVSALVPDLHHFRGSFGAKDVVPLWRDTNAEEPNVTEGLLEQYAATVGTDVDPEELFAYCYAILSAPSYTTRFAAELEVPGPRIPLTGDSELFETAVELGERLVWLHTYGARFVPPGYRAARCPRARLAAPSPSTARPRHIPRSTSTTRRRRAFTLEAECSSRWPPTFAASPSPAST